MHVMAPQHASTANILIFMTPRLIQLGMVWIVKYMNVTRSMPLF